MTTPDDTDGSVLTTIAVLGRRLYLWWSAMDRGWKATVIGLLVLGTVLVQP
ncbi:hypothetical protein [Haloarcula montana]|uniref:hypothetical protein n=1 Tax=Haloarcula montana TaxID=3111776 RepID=UPI002D7955EC|nr:hypothetical protein [Haloarcula sp. GH36]